MPALIAFRALQGLGAGAVQPTAMTIIGDIYSIEERAKVQGYVASVWAISAVVGPTLGGLFVDFLTGAGSSSSHPVGWDRGLGVVAEVPRAVDGSGTGSTTRALPCSPPVTLLLLGLLEGGVLAWGRRRA